MQNIDMSIAKLPSPKPVSPSWMFQTVFWNYRVKYISALFGNTHFSCISAVLLPKLALYKITFKQSTQTHDLNICSTSKTFRRWKHCILFRIKWLSIFSLGVTRVKNISAFFSCMGVLTIDHDLQGFFVSTSGLIWKNT